MQGMLAYVVRRLLWLPVTLLAVSFLTFTIARLGPGDPVTAAGTQIRDPEAFDRVRSHLGLDKPLHEQYWIYLKGLVRGDLGDSYKYRDRSVAELIFPKIWVSARVGLLAIALTFLVGVPAGLVAAHRQGTWTDPLVISILLFFQSVPVLVMLPVLVLVFSLKLDWLPPAGWDGVFSTKIILPVIALSLPGMAGVARLVRATTLDVLGQDYVRTARAKGLSEFTVLKRHVVRNAMLPLVTVIGLSLVAVLEGAFFTEVIMGIPGIGNFAFEAVKGRDYNVILGITLVLAVAFIVANIVVDIAYTVIDPRVRYQGVEP